MSSGNHSRAIKDFLAESEEILEKLNLDLVHLGEQLENGGAIDPDLLNSIFRGAHSFKGLAGMFGFEDISELSHHLENLLDSLRLGKVPLSAQMVGGLFELLETLSRLVHGKADAEDFTFDLSDSFAKIDSLLNPASQKSAARAGNLIPEEILRVLTEYEEYRLQENLRNRHTIFRVSTSFSLVSFDQDLAALTDQLRQFGEVISTLPSACENRDRIGFQILVGTAAGVQKIDSFLQGDDLQLEILSAESKSDVSELPALIPGAVPAPQSEENSSSLRSISRTVRVDIDKLDTLMNIVGELVLAKSAIATLADRLRQESNIDLALDLQKATRVLERRLDELQQGVMEVRMVPVAQLFEKMVRIVRRVSGEHGKKISLDLRGAETELDKLIVEDLSDPLMHLIRNAIDHGIEPSEERVALGKPEKGTICLWASQKGNHVVLEVRDDGRGIDADKVRKKAIEKKLIAENAELNREDIYNLIFLPGFSTRDAVTDLSGRGVGMDVVHNNIAALSGLVEIDSQPGLGTTMTITLPITLAIIKALIVQLSGRTYAIPINSVQETLMIESSQIRTVERREVIELRSATLPLLRLSDTFGLERGATRNGRSFVVVTGMGEKRLGIMVDELIGQQDVVIKSLGSTLSFVRGIAGAADLGNQKTILVLDIAGLMNEALRGESVLYV